jgi:hypothetical protein
MTRDEVLNMPAGEKMDIAILVYLTNWKEYNTADVEFCRFQPSRNIADAWKVVEHLQKEPYVWQFEIANLAGGKKSCEAILWGGEDDTWIEFDARGETMALAICRTGLLFCMNFEDESMSVDDPREPSAFWSPCEKHGKWICIECFPSAPNR